MGSFRYCQISLCQDERIREEYRTKQHSGEKDICIIITVKCCEERKPDRQNKKQCLKLNKQRQFQKRGQKIKDTFHRQVNNPVLNRVDKLELED